MATGRHLITLFVCGYILFVADVLGVMMYSGKIYRTPLYGSFALSVVFTGIGVYLTLVVGRQNKNWEATHQRYIHVATGCIVAACLLWVIALWPVFHVWTLLLGLAWLFFVLSAITIVPTGKVKQD